MAIADRASSVYALDDETGLRLLIILADPRRNSSCSSSSVLCRCLCIELDIIPKLLAHRRSGRVSNHTFDADTPGMAINSIESARYEDSERIHKKGAA